MFISIYLHRVERNCKKGGYKMLSFLLDSLFTVTYLQSMDVYSSKLIYGSKTKVCLYSKIIINHNNEF